jgi:hypothetical protein
MTTTRALIEAEKLYYAFWTRNLSPGTLPATPFADQADAIRDMWRKIADDARAILLPPDAPSPDRERVARIITALGLMRAYAMVGRAFTDEDNRIVSEAEDAILALTAADPIPIEREGFVLVPREPTEAMLTAGHGQDANEVAPDALEAPSLIRLRSLYERHARRSSCPIRKEEGRRERTIFRTELES